MIAKDFQRGLLVLGTRLIEVPGLHRLVDSVVDVDLQQALRFRACPTRIPTVGLHRIDRVQLTVVEQSGLVGLQSTRLRGDRRSEVSEVRFEVPLVVLDESNRIVDNMKSVCCCTVFSLGAIHLLSRGFHVTSAVF